MKAISPELGKNTLLALQFARSLVDREEYIIENCKETRDCGPPGSPLGPTRPPTPAPTPFKIPLEPLPPATPSPTATPTAPSPAPTAAPTSAPTKNYDWSVDAPSDDVVPELLPDHYEPGDVDIDPTKEPLSAQ